MGVFKPSWWKQEHGTSWERMKEAIRRDWQQTKHDLHAGGHELNQKIGDTVKQATGKENVPPIDRANPPRVIGTWDEAEIPVGYGHAARQQFGAQHPVWTDELESKLRTEWEKGKDATHHAWADVRRHVKYGYDFGGRSSRASSDERPSHP